MNRQYICMTAWDFLLKMWSRIQICVPVGRKIRNLIITLMLCRDDANDDCKTTIKSNEPGELNVLQCDTLFIGLKPTIGTNFTERWNNLSFRNKKRNTEGNPIFIMFKNDRGWYDVLSMGKVDSWQMSKFLLDFKTWWSELFLVK